MVIDLNEQLLAEFDNNNTKQNSTPIHEGTSSFFQATFNNVGVLVGLGMLSCPYALEQGGWLGLVFLITCGIICCYTAHLIGLCLASKPGISTYQQIAECAFGWTGRVLVTVLVYMELFGTLTGFTISLKDNLVKIFPHASVNFAWIHIPPTQLLPTVAVLLVLPVICMRDLKWVSYVSLGGIAAYFMIVLSVLWAGVADGVGFHQTVPLLRPSKLSEVLGLYAFCYAGHLVVPRIYSSMKNPSQYPKVATVTFSIATLIYITVATAGATMFGESIRSQVTLNLPTYLPVSKVALWVVILIPLTKYALNVNPIAVELEALALALRPSQPYIIQLISSTIIRTLLMVFVLTLALSVPAFETTLALVGSAISVSTCIVLPCLFYAQIFRESISASKLALSLLLAALGVGLATIGTLAAVRKLW